LLVLGRVVAVVISLATQVLIVRQLSKSAYGSFAYALSVISTARILVDFGHQKAVAHFLSLYDERGEKRKLVGTVVMEIRLIAGTGLLAFLVVAGFRNLLAGNIIDDEQAISLLVIMILLAPLEALDGLFESVVAVLGEASAIFFRKYLLAPLLRLGAVALLVLFDAPVRFLAAGYVAAGLIGLVAYASIIYRVLQRRQLLAYFRKGSFKMPVREVFGFALPLLTYELVFIAVNTISILLVGYFSGTEEVAAYRAVAPIARVNQLVGWTFAVLFMPMAARFFARGDRSGMRDAYWRTSLWLTVLTFPIFAVTGPLARPVTQFLFGARYADSALLLGLLSLGYYLNISLGFNSLALQTFGRIRYLVTVNLVSVVFNLVLGWVLISRHGSLGVAITNAATLVLLNLLTQLGLPSIGIGFLDRRFARAYATIVAGGLGLWLLQLRLNPPLLVGLVIAGLLSIGLLVINRRHLRADESFPELQRIPWLGRWLT